MPPRILIFVQHLWGVGHVSRSLAMAGACADRGARVTVVLGGPPTGLPVPAGVNTVQLPPVTAGDPGYRTLVTGSGDAPDTGYWDRRRRRLLDTLTRDRPTHVVTEHFPFGRRKQRPEFLALLEAARAMTPRPVILASIRDIVEDPGDPERRAAQIALAGRFYDRILVHGDRAILPLDASLPHAAALRTRIVYTGYVHRAVPASPRDRRGIVVTAGGGRDARPLIEATMALHARGAPEPEPWTLVTGRDAPEPAMPVPPSLTVIRHDPDLPRRLAEARIAVTRAGYNTVAEALAARVGLVLVPYGDAGQTEQPRRAEALVARGLASMVRERADGPDLAMRIEAALAAAPPPGSAQAPLLDGAARTADILFTVFASTRPYS